MVEEPELIHIVCSQCGDHPAPAATWVQQSCVACTTAIWVDVDYQTDLGVNYPGASFVFICLPCHQAQAGGLEMVSFMSGQIRQLLADGYTPKRVAFILAVAKASEGRFNLAEMLDEIDRSPDGEFAGRFYAALEEANLAVEAVCRRN